MATEINKDSLEFNLHLLTGCNSPPPYLLLEFVPAEGIQVEWVKSISKCRYWGFWGDIYVYPQATFEPTAAVGKSQLNKSTEVYNFEIGDVLNPTYFQIVMRTIAIVHDTISPSSNMSWSIAGTRYGPRIIGSFHHVTVILKREGSASTSTLVEKDPGLGCLLSQIRVVIPQYSEPSATVSFDKRGQPNTASVGEQLQIQRGNKQHQAISTKS